MVRRLAVRLAIVVTLLLGACGDDDGSADGGSSRLVDERTADQKVADFDLADAALLELADFPEGWVVKPNSEDQAADEELYACLQTDDVAALRNEEAEAERGFGNDADDRVLSSVNVYPNVAFARVNVEIGRAPRFAECYRSGLEGVVRPGLSEGQTVAVTIDPLEVPALGEDALGFRLVATITDGTRQLQRFVDIAVVREGRAVTSVTSISTGAPLDTALFQQLLTTTTERLSTV